MLLPYFLAGFCEEFHDLEHGVCESACELGGVAVLRRTSWIQDARQGKSV